MTLKTRRQGSCRVGGRQQSGIALLEALISVLMLSLGILALVGLQAAMNTNTTDAKYRAEASYLANQLFGQMAVDQVDSATNQSNLPKYAVSAGACSAGYAPCSNWLAQVANRLPAGTATVVVNGTAVTVTVSWTTPGAAIPHNVQMVGNVSS